MDLKIKASFSSAHSLKGTLKDKCLPLHGHNYNVVFTFTGSLNEYGMVQDFAILKGIINKVLEKYDHKCLNDFIDNPTVEIIGKRILQEVRNLYIEEFNGKDNFTSVEVWETDKYGVVIHYED